MNIYRGCQHGCIYCDGRAEKYQAGDNFENQITVKTNAVELLKKELDPNRKRKPLKKGFIGLCGGVSDSYQSLEKKYKLTRGILSVLEHHPFPIHILTKSTLIQRDFDLIKRKNKKDCAIVSMSFSSVDDRISKIFEPGVPPPSERLSVLSEFKKAGITCGMYLMPVIPFITDKPAIIENCFKKAKATGLDFIIFSGMTLKEGRQKNKFFQVLNNRYPNLLPEYNTIYKDNKWGNALNSYYDNIHKPILNLARKYRMFLRIPVNRFNKFLPVNDIVVCILEQIDYLRKLRGQKSPFGYAAYSISQIKSPLSEMDNCLRTIKGVGEVTERIILDIINTGSSSYYESLLKNRYP